MQTLNLVQGSPEWLAARAAHFCASDAPAMMGTSPYKTRNELLKEKATGVTAEIDDATQARFDRGHEAEAAARLIAEDMIYEELFPAVGVATVDGLPLLASFDGITMLEDIIYEHKLFNQDLADYITQNDDLPDSHWPQVEHQLLISGAKTAVFVTSNGTPDKFVSIPYESLPERRAAVIAGWKQFDADLKAYQPTETKPEIVARPTEALLAPFAQVQGAVSVRHNLPDFRAQLESFIEKLNDSPETDQDFADLDAAVKTLSAAEDALLSVKNQGIAQVEDVEKFARAVDDAHAVARAARLKFEKIVKAEKDNRKAAIVNTGVAAFRAHIDELNAAIGKPYMPQVPADFAGAAKGLKTISSIQNAVDTELARAKIAASNMFASIQKNMASLRELAKDHALLFADAAQLVTKPNDDVVTLIKARITEHKAAEAKRLEAERERIRAEEQAKVQQSVAQPATTAAVMPAVVEQSVSAPAQASAVGRNIKLGEICDRLGFTVTAQFLESLGFTHAGRERAALLYRESDFPLICTALIRHIQHAAQHAAAA